MHETLLQTHGVSMQTVGSSLRNESVEGRKDFDPNSNVASPPGSSARERMMGD
eukprot:CAMPEP_0114147852 /NCGR_PEP_ID=MMETSP0043_2-20121206/21325_1 /TAXON_ID=464988 /ORGANISM="Hemiselmis andersenii, Strain CCMP644" /LENGTH=52 /DNA_ID=CAMNT_0001242413 /DNA_START=341 /DNA_END=499 /DNA_ORIENTATION=+